MTESEHEDPPPDGGKPTDRYQKVRPDGHEGELSGDSTPLATEVSEVSDDLIHRLAQEGAGHVPNLEGEMREDPGADLPGTKEGPRKTQRYDKIVDEGMKERQAAGPEQATGPGRATGSDQAGGPEDDQNATDALTDAVDTEATPIEGMTSSTDALPAAGAAGMSDPSPVDESAGETVDMGDPTPVDGGAGETVDMDVLDDTDAQVPPAGPAAPDETAASTPRASAQEAASRGQDPMLGKTVGGLVLEEVIGRGGMGVIYRGRHPHLRKDFAIKILPDRLAQLPPFVERFINEGRAAARLTHPNAVRVNAAGIENNVHFIVMELLQGRDLRRIVEEKGSLHEFEVMRIALEVSHALRAAHGVGMIHRDIKPENLILESETGRIRVTDFGLSMDTSADLAAVEASIGTPNYMSPEQCRGLGCDQRSDVYALGATCYYLLTHRPPYQGHTAAAVMIQHISEPPTDPRVYAPRTSDEFAQVVMRMMAKDPAHRYASAAELADELERVRRGDAPSESPAGSPPRGDAQLHAALLDAMQKRADDMHLVIESGGAELLLRIDGRLEHDRRLEADEAQAIRGAILQAAGIAEMPSPSPRTGLMTLSGSGGTHQQVYVGLIPGAASERLVLRILPPSERYSVSMESLDLEEHASRLEAWLQARRGAVVATSPAASTPSGRPSSRVLYGLLASMSDLPLALATIEEDVELLFEGVSQVLLDASRGLDQSVALQALMDQDVDVCLIRDVQPTMFVDAFQAARSGRLLLLEGGQDGTIAMLRRLREHGVPAEDLIDCCPGIIASLEIPLACQECLSPVVVMPRDSEAFAVVAAGLEPLPETIPQPAGCAACKRLQTVGVTLVHEILVPGRALLDAIAAGASDDELRQIAAAAGHVPLTAALRELLVAGRVLLADTLVLLGRLQQQDG